MKAQIATLIPPGETVLEEIFDKLFGLIEHRTFVVGALLDDPHRLGKRLSRPLDDRHSARRGTYCVVYRINDDQRIVTIVDISHRRDAYRATAWSGISSDQIVR